MNWTWRSHSGLHTGAASLLEAEGSSPEQTSCFQVLASYINPAGFSSVHTFDASSSDNMSQNSSALPAMLQELLSQSCLIPAMSSYLRNDSGGCCGYERGGSKD